MYSRKAWGGNVDPFILTKFSQDSEVGDSDPLVSLVIFEWTDEPLIGRLVSDDAEVCPLRLPATDLCILTSILSLEQRDDLRRG